ncbi:MULTISPECIES: hypothetical protein [Streptomyces]|uniref:Uncharacterized protein n=1 Tax=Streptomyces koelreuteriae TaxID=2838015 RepID=A0ABX8FQ79_9ACTN|nr:MULTISPECIES: hypothetical protein [Streptomyces]QWB23331.1 hypothetical protein KJK29_12350 [Streptomyces koelreuteriae]UUA06283.1 hypothetical protein NNW98_12405 [Streptomyces koelreuteriae]UUA13910.1 hypothetical protein NNW99_12405 [Streptomyces sp. CRCS-T-1]
MNEPGTEQPNAEETWDPQIDRWRDPEGDYALPRAMRSLPPPWNECDWGRIAELPRSEERLAEARRVVTVLLEDPELAPHVPQPPSPGLLHHAWEEFHQAVVKSMPRTSQVTWSGADDLVRAWQDRPHLYPLQLHVVRHVEAAMPAMIASLRDDIADSAIELLTVGGPEAQLALKRLSVKPGGPANWDNAEAARSRLLGLGSEGTSD